VRALLLRLAREDGRNFRSLLPPSLGLVIWEKGNVLYLKSSMASRDYDKLVGDFPT